MDVFLQHKHLEASNIDELAGYLGDFHETSMAATSGEYGSELVYTLEFDTVKGEAKNLPTEIHRALELDRSAQLAM